MTVEPATISAVTALVAVVVSPVVSVYVARRQIRAAVVSANRQAWINQLREALAELLTSLRFLNFRRDGDLALTTEAWVDRFERVHHLSNKVTLLLNAQETDHQELRATLTEAGNLLFDGPERGQKIQNAIERITAQSQAILKREWERVKRGD